MSAPNGSPGKLSILLLSQTFLKIFHPKRCICSWAPTSNDPPPRSTPSSCILTPKGPAVPPTPTVLYLPPKRYLPPHVSPLILWHSATVAPPFIFHFYHRPNFVLQVTSSIPKEWGSCSFFFHPSHMVSPFEMCSICKYSLHSQPSLLTWLEMGLLLFVSDRRGASSCESLF